MNKLVGVGFQSVASVVDFLACSAITTLSVNPRMADVAIADVASLVVEVRNAVLAAGILRAVEAATTHHGGQLRDGKPKELVVHDVVDALLPVGNFVGQTCNQALCYLTEKDSTLRARVEEAGVRTLEQLLRQQVEHLIGKSGRSKHFVVAQVSQTRQYVGVVVLGFARRHSSRCHSVIHSQAV